MPGRTACAGKMPLAPEALKSGLLENKMKTAGTVRVYRRTGQKDKVCKQDDCKTEEGKVTYEESDEVCRCNDGVFAGGILTAYAGAGGRTDTRGGSAGCQYGEYGK